MRPAQPKDKAPVTEPTASIEESSPNPPEPVPKTLTAMAETNTAKFMQKVATTKSIVSTASNSGRART